MEVRTVFFLFFFFGASFRSHFHFFFLFACFNQKQENAEIIDLDKTTVTLEAEKISVGGLFVPGKDRVVYQRPERKSILGIKFNNFFFNLVSYFL